MPSAFKKSVVARVVHENRVWIYRYSHSSEPWTLSIATLAEPGSKRLSLGGFRIAPPERTSLPGFNTDDEATDLAIGMEEKVFWSRLIRVGGPLAQHDFNRIVGGKCVLLPTPDARVGKLRDFELLDFAIACLNDCERSAGIHITTGQDLGHGVMSDGITQSLQYLNSGFPGSVVADTSQPTAEGNFYTLVGMLGGLDIDIGNATIGFIGCGNLGRALIPLLAPFRPRLLIHDPWLPDSLIRELGGEPATLDQVLREPRMIFALAGVTEENTKLLDRERLSALRSDAALVLLSRAGLVDFDALIDLVAARRFRAATDVFPIEPVPPNDRVRHVEGLLLSAHRAGGLPSALAAIGEVVVDDLTLILGGLPPQRLQAARPETVMRWRNPPGRSYAPGTRL